MSDLTNIWIEGDCLSQAQLLDYIQQKLDRDEMYMVETHINDCPLCSDALDGLYTEDITQTSTQLSEIKWLGEEQIRKTFSTPILQPALVEKEESKKSPPLSFSFTKSKWSVAAGLLLLVGLGGYSVYSYYESQQHHELALETGNTKLDKTEYKIDRDTNANEMNHLSVKTVEDIPNAEVQPNIDNRSKRMEQKEDLSQTVKNLPFIPNANPKLRESSASLDAPISKQETANESTVFADKEMQNQSDDFAKSEQKYIAPQNEIQAKPSVAGLKKSKEMITNYAPSANQMNYSSYNNSTTKNADEFSAVQGAALSSVSVAKNGDAFEKGKSLFNRGNFKRSIRLFEKALQESNASNKEDIQYYLAQAYIEVGENEKALALISTLNSSSKYKSRSTELLQRVTK